MLLLRVKERRLLVLGALCNSGRGATDIDIHRLLLSTAAGHRRRDRGFGSESPLMGLTLGVPCRVAGGFPARRCNVGYYRGLTRSIWAQCLRELKESGSGTKAAGQVRVVAPSNPQLHIQHAKWLFGLQASQMETRGSGRGASHAS